MTSYYKYIFPCITEGIPVETGYISTLPTACPNNNTHEVNIDASRVIGTIQDKVMVIKQNTTIDVKYFKTDYYEINIPANSTVSKDITYPYNVGIYTTTYMATLNNIGDELNVYVAPNGTAGLLADNVDIGATTLSLATTYFTVSPGMYLKLTDGVNTDELGEIKSISNTGVITFTNPTSHSFVTNNIVKFYIYRVKNLLIVNDKNITVGKNKIEASPVPANTVMRFTYKNNGNIDKKFSFIMEIGY
ncbi:hypothetical protein Hokovirus_3_192 [Hokovirus HKV1]|uniref:Uncharacterized protein n=1 Tax=Hokovirus HKV1 TaxID=1977638 RepID=A0A1V0SGS4_9VIRU|nr:hypothetical protein Hokovirus_3_192 [Hokovirus HKV1]